MIRLPRGGRSGSREPTCGLVSARWGCWSLNSNGAGDPPKTWFTGSGRKRVERVFGTMMSKPVREMKASDIIREADGYGGSQHAAQNAIRALRPVISWAVLRDYAPVGLKALSPEQGVPKRARVLTHDELRRVLPILRSGKSRHATVMLFILLTLARLNEAAGATWAEIDLDRRTWTILPRATERYTAEETQGGATKASGYSAQLGRGVAAAMGQGRRRSRTTIAGICKPK